MTQTPNIKPNTLLAQAKALFETDGVQALHFTIENLDALREELATMHAEQHGRHSKEETK